MIFFNKSPIYAAIIIPKRNQVQNLCNHIVNVIPGFIIKIKRVIRAYSAPKWANIPGQSEQLLNFFR